jgi:hypothetical protein
VSKKWLLLLLMLSLLLSGCLGEKKVQDILPKTIPGFIIISPEVKEWTNGACLTCMVYTEPNSELKKTVDCIYLFIYDWKDELVAKNELSSFKYNTKKEIQVEDVKVLVTRTEWSGGGIPGISILVQKNKFLVECRVQEIMRIEQNTNNFNMEKQVDSMIEAGLKVMKAIVPNLPD